MHCVTPNLRRIRLRSDPALSRQYSVRLCQPIHTGCSPTVVRTAGVMIESTQYCMIKHNIVRINRIANTKRRYCSQPAKKKKNRAADQFAKAKYIMCFCSVQSLLNVAFIRCCCRLSSDLFCAKFMRFASSIWQK